MTAPAQSGRAGAGRLLGLGARAALSGPGLLLGVALTLAAAACARSVVRPALFLAGNDDVRRLVGLGAWGLVVLAALARGIALAWAVRAGEGRIRGGQPTLEARALGATSLTGLAWAVGVAAVHLTLFLWFSTGIVSTAVVFVLGKGPLPLLGAAGLAGVLSVAAIAAPVLGLWLELALVRAVVRREGIALAGAEAWHTLGQRPGFVVGAWLATALPAVGVAGTVQVFLGMRPPPSWATVAAQGTGLLLVALIDAVAAVVRLDAYAALELDREGALPAPPPPPDPAPVVPRATLVPPASVVQARLVPPPDGGVSG
jgi:hypothetical protein